MRNEVIRLKYIKIFLVFAVLGILLGVLNNAKASVIVWCHNDHSHVCVESNHNCSHKVNSEGWSWGRCATITPTVTPRPTKIPKPTDVPEPTPTPEVTPTPRTPDPGSCNGCGHTMDPPMCTDGTTILLPANFHVIRNGVSATLKWWPTQGGQVNVFYKEVDQKNWTHGLADQLNNGNLTIGGLNPNLGYTFGLMQKNGCGGGQLVTSVVIDGPQSRLFTFSYWMWE